MFKYEVYWTHPDSGNSHKNYFDTSAEASAFVLGISWLGSSPDVNLVNIQMLQDEYLKRMAQNAPTKT